MLDYRVKGLLQASEALDAPGGEADGGAAGKRQGRRKASQRNGMRRKGTLDRVASLPLGLNHVLAKCWVREPLEDRVAAGSFTAPGRRSREMTDEQELATKEGRNPCQPTQRERSLKGSWRRTNGSRKRNSGTKAGAFLN
ncbi:hypothetical protein Y1Q_0018165 [Alligator mississippiensis]|uniref:Uncharacterized protein n=1 Tax=Alligator mississippiensis TaxID=8496 RepID=A0A151NCF7_ALLMI|nr:hypothetical protein Y1Q_0018165 [Alligator mississippiensis]